MTYTIGDKRINLDAELNQEEQELILSHSKLFKYCLNNASFKLLISVKNIVHLYNDIITIYSTLLRKIPNYDDITLMTSITKLSVGNLEDKFSQVFGASLNEDDILAGKKNWQFHQYEATIKPFAVNLLLFTQQVFETIYKTLNCIDVFFNSFDNLKKLSIPYLMVQTAAINNCITKTLYLFNLSTISDHLSSIKTLTPSILKQLKKIEKVTTGLENEAVILQTGFNTFDASLQRYTNILLGKAILKRDINYNDCQIIKRRDVCYQAAEHVVSIPLSEDHSTAFTMKMLTKYVIYMVMVVVMMVLFIGYRFLRVCVGK